MCGIISYLGTKQASPILIKGLKRLEYRGYDSAGISILNQGQITSLKVKGKIKKLEKSLQHSKLQGNVGIAHTRWATHGPPSQKNAHPHFDCSKTISIVHNGIIENVTTLKKLLSKEGHKFSSQTDSEVLAHLIEKYKTNNTLTQAVQLALRQVEGAYAIVIISSHEPNTLVAARKGSSLVIGLAKNQYLAASDASAIASYAKDIIYLDDDEIATLTPAGYKIINSKNNSNIVKKIEKINQNLNKIEKQNFKTFMQKEIFEQPDTIANCLRGHITSGSSQIKLDGLEKIKDKINDISRIIILGCGTSWHAGLIAEYLFEELVKIPVEVEYASEFRYRQPIIGKNTLIIALSQSGETADTLAALKLAKEKNAPTFGICNVVGSSLARFVDAGAYLHAGPEIGVASTKAFTSQLVMLAMLAVHFSYIRKTQNSQQRQQIIKGLALLPAQVKKILKQDKQIFALAKKFKGASNFLYLGRGYNFPVALEGALKLKEISYIHAEGYPAAEMKHGPIALIDKQMPVVFIASKDNTYDKIISNIEEVKARNGQVIALASKGDTTIKKLADHVIYVPHSLDILMPILNTIPLQLLAYHIARLKGFDVDKPRNLAKSVTVE
ncbi:MAG: glutamine--fructose-6-phosphate transaminase (isomerizing) [Candidatus Kuenenbacteria bacterium]